jgi:hypothetical protein
MHYARSAMFGARCFTTAPLHVAAPAYSGCGLPACIGMSLSVSGSAKFGPVGHHA